MFAYDCAVLDLYYPNLTYGCRIWGGGFNVDGDEGEHGGEFIKSIFLGSFVMIIF